MADDGGMTPAANHPDDLVTLVVKPNEFEAGAVVAVLAEAGIEAFAFGAPHAALPLDERLMGVPVQVRQSDLERAQAALRQNVADSVDLDWDEVDVGQRDDDLPLTPVNHTPPAARIGYWMAVIIMAAMLLAALWVVISMLL